jgi:putative FmdB family regulatory protein
MPLYEYKCDFCGDVFEVLQKFSDAPLTVHSKCGSGPVERLISTSALQFKGSGFYITDYKGSGGKADSQPSDSAKTDTKDSAKGDGKKDTNGSGKPASESSSKTESKKTESKTSDSSSSSTSSTPSTGSSSTKE